MRLMSLLLAGALLAAGEAEAQSAMVVGNVTDSADVPIAGANVELVGLARATTDSAGIFRFREVPAGTFILRSAKLGYAPWMRAVTTTPTDTLIVTAILAPSSAVLQPIVVRAESTITATSDPTGFLWRKKTGMGTYLDAIDIEKAHAPDVDRLLKSIPGIQVEDGEIRVSRESQSFQSPCIGAQVLIDGVPLAPDLDLRTGRKKAIDVNMIPVAAIRGIEVYKSVATLPAELRTGNNTCGVVAIWTRAR